MRCEYVANGLQQRGERMRMRCLQIANTWRTNCNNVANIRRMRGEQFATMQHSKNKNHTFVTQKPPFCTSKTILLHRKNHTFVMRICNIQKTNTLQTFHKCVANNLQQCNIQKTKTILSQCKNPIFAIQKSDFCNFKRVFFAGQKGSFCKPKSVIRSYELRIFYGF